MSIKSFAFHDLETLGRQEIGHTNALIEALDAGEARTIAVVTRILEDVFQRRDVQIDFAGVTRHEHTPQPAIASTAWRAFGAVAGNAFPFLLAIDGELAADWLSVFIEDESRRQFQTSESRAFGAIAYMVLRAAHELGQKGSRTFVFESTPPIDEAVDRFFSRSLPLVELAWIFSDRTTAGWVRVFLPAPLVQSLEFERETPKLWNALLEGPLGDRKIGLSALLGWRRGLTRDDISALRPGDIVFPESHGLAHPELNATTGHLRLKNHAFHGTFYAEPGAQWRFEITDDTPQLFEEPAVNEEHHEDDVATQSLNIPALHAAVVDLDVRVGGIELSVAELGRLKPGQVLELDRRVGDLVDLVVQGDLVARGELVNVEGTLGVRVTTLSS